MKVQTRIVATLDQVEALILEACEVETQEGDKLTTEFDPTSQTVIVEVIRE